MEMSVERIAEETMEHWMIYFPRVWKKADRVEAKKLAMLLAKLTKKEMTNLQKIVPGMSDYEAWTETMQEYCITPYPPDIPKAEKRVENVEMTKEKKKREVRQSQTKLFD
ncbi:MULTISPECIES: hypothetical protein [Synergistaceae]|jgi:hypothetical protein|uniref:hypothetical protein n=1 Tax=Synergistaceae TaxID=649777 RepID=UPI000EC89BA1|nr:hypothetical protein [Synergistaceae bacterium DZ-S4]HCR84483.1 hypothetical protein [Lachnospiraceae bacterium]